jgi:hypothetical protein
MWEFHLIELLTYFSWPFFKKDSVPWGYIVFGVGWGPNVVILPGRWRAFLRPWVSSVFGNCVVNFVRIMLAGCV